MKRKVYKHISKTEHPVSTLDVFGIAHGEKITIEVLKNALLSGGLTKKMNAAFGSLIVRENLWDDAMELARHDDNRVAFRASWGLEWAYDMAPEQIESRWGCFFEDFLASTNESVQRVYSKMICDMMRRGAVSLTADDADRMAEKCFDLLIDPDTHVAMKVWQIEVLADLSSRIWWIEGNLSATVRAMSESCDCPPAMAAHARHYFKRMGK